jgi:hypothetical protein
MRQSPLDVRVHRRQVQDHIKLRITVAVTIKVVILHYRVIKHGRLYYVFLVCAQVDVLAAAAPGS